MQLVRDLIAAHAWSPACKRSDINSFSTRHVQPTLLALADATNTFAISVECSAEAAHHDCSQPLLIQLHSYALCNWLPV